MRDLWEPAVTRLIQRAERFAEESAGNLEAQAQWARERSAEERAVFHNVRVNTPVAMRVARGERPPPQHVDFKVPTLGALSLPLHQMLLDVCFPIWDPDAHDL
jgi:hypothetical protein